MTPLEYTLVISASMLALSQLPLQIRAVRAHSKLLFLTGTGALAGLLVFDLVPDVLQMGGHQGLLWIVLVWAVYSIFHLLHVHHHGEGHAPDSGRVGVFLFAISAHCFSSGMLLAISDDFTASFRRAVFLALLAHKCYEALTVSSVVADRVPAKRRAFLLIFLYTLSLPAGEALTACFRDRITPELALIVTCVATGSLLGCLYSDFLVPSLGYLRSRKLDAAWLVGGLLVTELLVRSF